MRIFALTGGKFYRLPPDKENPAVTKKDTSWQWANEQQLAFDRLKDSLTKN